MDIGEKYPYSCLMRRKLSRDKAQVVSLALLASERESGLKSHEMLLNTVSFACILICKRS